MSDIIVLFQGDSVTDACRTYDDPASLGQGYPMMIAASYGSMYPEQYVQFINRGVSGDRVINLQKRWQSDCIELQPDVVSILIGVNDTWRRYDSNDPTSTEAFEKVYRDILTQTREKTDAQIILMEPFVLPYPEDRIAWREDLDPRIHVVRSLAREFEAALIPLDGIFAQASARREIEFWAADGVHPTLAGHALIARAWIETVEELGIL
ncbi:MAG: SGNH/GDSL hydrolase family protein [Armatimonadota bacterium]|nr:SGNH/GDSL hydrolase family protein [bacterium]